MRPNEFDAISPMHTHTDRFPSMLVMCYTYNTRDTKAFLILQAVDSGVYIKIERKREKYTVSQSGEKFSISSRFSGEIC